MTLELQQEALRILEEVCELAPEVRLGQLMAHLGFLGEAHLGKGLGYLDDDELLAILYRHRAELLARLQGLPPIATSTPSASLSGSPTVPGP